MDTVIIHDKERNQFIATIEGMPCTLHYVASSDGKTLDFRATFVPAPLRGRHIGEEIVKFALDYIQNNHLKVIPTCPFVTHYINRHSEYRDLVALQ
jgi:hypothetical protein